MMVEAGESPLPTSPGSTASARPDAPRSNPCADRPRPGVLRKGRCTTLSPLPHHAGARQEAAEVVRLPLPTGYGLASAPDDRRASAFACKPRLVGGVESGSRPRSVPCLTSGCAPCALVWFCRCAAHVTKRKRKRTGSASISTSRATTNACADKVFAFDDGSCF